MPESMSTESEGLVMQLAPSATGNKMTEVQFSYKGELGVSQTLLTNYRESTNLFVILSTVQELLNLCLLLL
jgi:hypothetical protein